MNIKTNKKFIKDLDSISDPFVFKQVKLVNDILCKIENIQMIPSCKKIVGQKDCYRIRLGNYRIGFIYKDETIFLERILHRSTIYKYFP